MRPVYFRVLIQTTTVTVALLQMRKVWVSIKCFTNWIFLVAVGRCLWTVVKIYYISVISVPYWELLHEIVENERLRTDRTDTLQSWEMWTASVILLYIQVPMDETCQPVLFFNLIDSEPIRKNGRTNQLMCQTKSRYTEGLFGQWKIVTLTDTRFHAPVLYMCISQQICAVPVLYCDISLSNNSKQKRLFASAFDALFRASPLFQKQANKFQQM